MSLLERIKANSRPEKKRSLTFGGTGQTFDQGPFWNHLNALGGSTSGSNQERIEHDYESYVQRAYKANAIVFGAISLRHQVFSEARFQWRPLRNGTPGDLFGTQALSILERPAPNQTTGELLKRMLITADLAGNYYGVRVDDLGRVGKAAVGGPGERIAHLRPDWVTIIVGSKSGDPNAIDAKVLGYQYSPLGAAGLPRAEAVFLTPDQVCHYSPEPDPEARFRGMSPLTPIIREVMADKAATEHKAKFFENGATPGVAIKFDKDTDEDAFDDFVASFKATHQGSWNAYKTLFLTGGADITPVSMDLKQLEFSTTQGAGESRILMALHVHPTLIGSSEGLQGSALNAGNYLAVRRSFVDGTMRPLWRQACAALESIVPPPDSSTQLWFDVRDIAFLRDDQTDVAAIRAQEAQTIRTLLDAGYEADSVVKAVLAEDWGLLKHSGLFSIQLQPPMTAADIAAAAEPTAPPKEVPKNA